MGKTKGATYDQAHVQEVHQILLMKKAGLSTAKIREAMAAFTARNIQQNESVKSTLTSKLIEHRFSFERGVYVVFEDSNSPLSAEERAALLSHVDSFIQNSGPTQSL